MRFQRSIAALLVGCIVSLGLVAVMVSETKVASAYPGEPWPKSSVYGMPPQDIYNVNNPGPYPSYTMTWRKVEHPTRGPMAMNPAGENITWGGGRTRAWPNFDKIPNGSWVSPYNPTTAGIQGEMQRWTYPTAPWNNAHVVIDTTIVDPFAPDRFKMFVPVVAPMIGVSDAGWPAMYQNATTSDYHFFQNFNPANPSNSGNLVAYTGYNTLAGWQSLTDATGVQWRAATCNRYWWGYAQYATTIAHYTSGGPAPSQEVQDCMTYGPPSLAINWLWHEGGWGENFDLVHFQYCRAGQNIGGFVCSQDGWIAINAFWMTWYGTKSPGAPPTTAPPTPTTTAPSPAVAVADQITVNGGQSATIDVLANDTGVTGKTVASTGGSVSNGSVSWSGGSLTYNGGYSINDAVSTISYTLASGSTANVTLRVVGQGPPNIAVNVTATPGRAEAMNCSRFAPANAALQQVPASAAPGWSPTFNYPIFTGVSGSASGSSGYTFGSPVAVPWSHTLLTTSGSESASGVVYGDYAVQTVPFSMTSTFQYRPRPYVRQYSSDSSRLMQGNNPLQVRPQPFALWFNKQFDVPYYFPNGTLAGTQRVTSNPFIGNYISVAVCPSVPSGGVVTVTIDASVIRDGSTNVSLTGSSSDALFSQSQLNVLPAGRPVVPSTVGLTTFSGNTMTFTPVRNLRGVSLNTPIDYPFTVTNPDGIAGTGTLRIVYTALPGSAT